MSKVRKRGDQLHETPQPNPTSIHAPATTTTAPTTTILPQVLIIGAIPNLYLLYTIHDLPFTKITLCANIFIAVNAFRCVFPNRYNNNIVLHDTFFSSIFLTRLLATFSEVAMLALLGIVAKDLNTISSPTMNIFADLLPLLCMVAQCFVWSSLLLQTESLMFWEESIWLVMYAINTGLNLVLLNHGIHSPLVFISIIFGMFYLPWQILGHLRLILSLENPPLKLSDVGLARMAASAERALCHRRQSVKYQDWGGWVGALWMFGYWVGLFWWMAAIVWQYQDHKL